MGKWWTAWGVAILVGLLGLTSSLCLVTPLVVSWEEPPALDSHPVRVEVERWLGLPLSFVTTYESAYMREYVTLQQKLTSDLSPFLETFPEPLVVEQDQLLKQLEALSEVGHSLPRAVDSESAAIHYVAEADALRVRFTAFMDAFDERASSLEAIKAGVLRRRAVASVGFSGLSLLILGAMAWAYRQWLATWSRGLARALEAEGDGDLASNHEGLVPGTGGLEPARAAVARLVCRLAEQTKSTQFQIGQQDLLRDFTEGLETCDDEPAAVSLFHRTLDIRNPGVGVDLMMSTNSENELRLVHMEVEKQGARCARDPSQCKALRLGRTLKIDDPGSLGACSRFDSASRSYACVPLSISGRSTSVLRMAKEEGVFSQHDILDLTTVVQRLAVRLGVIRLLAARTRQANTDPLTGLLNRRVLTDRAQSLLARTLDMPVAELAVFGMDLDRFKLLNDTHGHAVGDAVLCRFVRVIEAELPEGALFGRMGGEEFLVVVALDRDASAADFGWDLVKAVRRDIAERGGVATTVSVGLAVGPMDGRTLSDLMERADERLYDAKSAGRNRLIVPNWLGETCPQLVEAK